MRKLTLSIFQTWLLIQNVIGWEYCPLDDDFRRSYIGLALSPVDKSHTSGRIKIIWANERFKKGDQIALLKYQNGTGFERKYTINPVASQGTQETGIEVDFSYLQTSSLQGQCQKYYVSWIRDGHVRDINCLRDHSTWMYDMRDLLANRTLADIFLPGTHNSGAYEVSGWYAIVDQIFKSSMLTQDSDIMGQLMAGVRYIHVKVGYHPDNKESVWWVHKKNVPLVKLDTVIEQVIMFLNRTREIVIFDVDEFPVGFDTVQTFNDLRNHLWWKFMKYSLTDEFNWNVTLNQIWNDVSWGEVQTTGKVIVNVDMSKTPFSHLYGRHRVSIKHSSIKSNNLNNFFTDLDETERRPRDSNMTPHATFVELAAEWSPPALHFLSDLRKEADKTNANVSIWYHTRWYQLANIVAVDFLESSGIVDVAIKSNELRFGDFTPVSPPLDCVPPFVESNDHVQFRLQGKAIQDLLHPRIVENAVNKIYRQRTTSRNVA